MTAQVIPLLFFASAVSVVASAAAWLAEAGLRRAGAPCRGVWLAALALPPVLLVAPALGSALRALLGGETGDGGASAIPLAGLVELPPLVVGPGGSGAGTVVAGAAMLLWLAGTVLFLTVLGRAVAHLRREERSWSEGHVLERSVLLSPALGPAVTGVLRPRIVLPRWALELPERQLRFVLLHEESHVRAGDSRLLAAALALLALVPWNPIAWWQLRRLRLAVELDCDRRVLRRAPDRRAYGESLVAVAGRCGTPALGLAAFTENVSSLERRIVAMTDRPTAKSRLAGMLLVALAMVVAAQACGVEGPVGTEARSADEPEPVASVVTPELHDEPTFTPFTTAPEITNRQEVIDSMATNYPPLLRDAGIGGTVRVYFLIDEQGLVRRTLVDQSSGHAALDQAALRVAGVYRFRAALLRDEPTAVWVSFPITFQTP